MINSRDTKHSQEISNQERKIIVKIITKILTMYEERDSSISLRGFCNLLIKESDIEDKSSILKDIDSAFTTIDIASSQYRNLTQSQKEGKSKLNWLKSNIESTLSVANAEEIGEIIQQVQSALVEVNNEQLGLIAEEGLRTTNKVNIIDSVESDQHTEMTVHQFEDEGSRFVDSESSKELSSDNHSRFIVEEKFTTKKTQSENIDSDVVPLELEESFDVYTYAEKVSFEGMGQQVATNHLLNELQNNAVLSPIALAQQVDSITSSFSPSTVTPLEITKNYFESNIDDNDTTLSKLFAVGLLVAKHEAHIGILDHMNATEIAVIADSGLFFAKVAYKLSQGRVKLDQAVEMLSDKVVSSASAILQKVAKFKSRIAGAKAGAMIGTVFGPSGTALGGVGGYLAGELAGSGISEGIKVGAKKIAQAAKNVVKKTVEFAEKATSKIMSTASRTVSAIGKFFSSL